MPKEFVSKTLHNAAYNGDIKELKRLLASGIQINARNDKGNTSLVPAVIGPRSKSTKLKVIEFLMQNGIDVNAVNKDGETVLHAVVRISFWRKIHKKIVKRLIDYGADRKLKNNDGQAPYRLAFAEKNSTLGSLLIFYEVKTPQCSSCHKGKGFFGYFSSRRSSQDTVSPCPKDRTSVHNRHRPHTVDTATILHTSLLLNKNNSLAAHYNKDESQNNENFIPTRNERVRIPSAESPTIGDNQDEPEIVFSYKEETNEPKTDEHSHGIEREISVKKRESNPYASIDKEKKRESFKTDIIVYSSMPKIMVKADELETTNERYRVKSPSNENINDPRGGIDIVKIRGVKLNDNDEVEGRQDDEADREVAEILTKNDRRDVTREDKDYSAYESAEN